MKNLNDSATLDDRGRGWVPGIGNAGIEQRLLLDWKRLERPSGSRILLGFSGGPDSLALAVALQRIAPLAGVEPRAIHVDHVLRPESAAEAMRAAELADAIGVPCRVVRLPESPVTVHRGAGLEEAARRERFRALAAEAARIDAVCCVLAHHRDDQAETIMLHLLRGSGLAGAAGMVPLSTLAVPWWGGSRFSTRSLTIWRPWLDESRETIEAYLKAVAPRLEPMVDPSNADPRLLRNRVRQTVMPMLEETRPGATRALARFGALAGEDDRFLDELARQELKALRTPSGDFPLAMLVSVPLPLLRRLLRMAAMEFDQPYELSASRVDALVAGIRRGHGGVTIELGDDHIATISDGRLRFSSIRKSPDRLNK
jgi:tRNA(Ile)-lysidine synthase